MTLFKSIRGRYSLTEDPNYNQMSTPRCNQQDPLSVITYKKLDLCIYSLLMYGYVTIAYILFLDVIQIYTL